MGVCVCVCVRREVLRLAGSLWSGGLLYGLSRRNLQEFFKSVSGYLLEIGYAVFVDTLMYVVWISLCGIVEHLISVIKGANSTCSLWMSKAIIFVCHLVNMIAEKFLIDFCESFGRGRCLLLLNTCTSLHHHRGLKNSVAFSLVGCLIPYQPTIAKVCHSKSREVNMS